MEDFAKERMAICEKCGLYKQTDMGPKCNNQKWLNPDTNETSLFSKPGWIKGCGCMLRYRCANKNNHCVAKRW